MPDILQTLVPYAVGGMLLLALVLFVVALWYFRHGRRDRYWRQRRSASLLGWQLFLVSLTTAFVAAAVCLFSGFATAILEGSTPTVTAAIASVLLPSPTASTTPIYIVATELTEMVPSPTFVRPAMPTVRSTGRPISVPGTATPRPTQSATSTPRNLTPAPVVLSQASPTTQPDTAWIVPLESAVTPSAAANLQITAVDSEITGDLLPAHEGATLTAGITRIYFWVEYQDMTDGLAWERVLLHDEDLIQGGAYLWSGGDTGSEVYFFGDAAGFPAGEYEIRLSLAGKTITTLTVVIE